MTSLGFEYWNKVFPSAHRTVPRGTIRVGNTLEKLELKKYLQTLTPRNGSDNFYRLKLDKNSKLESNDLEFFQPIVSERPFYQHFKDAVRKDSIVADIGAYKGFYGILASKLEASKVHCFEPATPEKIQRNIEQNHLAYIENAGEVEIIDKHVGTDLLLDNYFSDRQKPDVVKVDVDGYELKVLQSAKKILSENRPVLFLEIHANQEIAEGDREDVYSLLEDLGYSVRKSWKRRKDTLAVLDAK